MAKPTPDAIPLETQNVETLHVQGEGGKVLTLAVTVADDENLTKLLEISTESENITRFIITHIQPSPEYRDVVTVYFRTQTVDEKIEMHRHLIFSQQIVAGENPERMEELLQQMFNGSNELVDDGDLANKVEELLEDIEKETRAVEHPEIVFSLELSLAEAHLSNILCTSTNAPAFVITSQDFPAVEEDPDGFTPDPEWSNFLGLVEYHSPDDPAYFESVGLMEQNITGVRMAQAPVADIQRAIGETVELLSRLADGEKDAIRETFSMWNQGNVLFKHVVDEDHSLTREDARIASVREAVKDLYLFTLPSNLAPHLRGDVTGPDAAEKIIQRYQEDAQFRQVMADDSDLEVTMARILMDSYEKSGFQLSENPTGEEIVSYYSTPLTNATYPPEWRENMNIIHMPLFEEHDWMGGNIDLGQMEQRGFGATTVAMMLTIAARWSRLRHIHERTNMSPSLIELMLRPLSPRGHVGWAFQEGAVMAQKGKDSMFRQLLSVNLPADNAEVERKPSAFMGAVIVGFSHVLLHGVTAHGFGAGMVTSRFTGDERVKAYMNDLLLEVEEAHREAEAMFGEDEEDERAEERICPVRKGTLSTFQHQDNYPMAVDALMGILASYTELVTLKQTDLEEGTPEWAAYRERVVRELLTSAQEEEG